MSESTPKCDSVFVDIESMSTDRGNSLVLSAAFVAFNIKDTIGPGALSYGAPWFGNVLKIYPSLRQQFMMGREASVHTQEWWRDSARNPARGDWGNAVDEPLEDCLKRAADFVKDADVWAHGIGFDLANLESLFTQAGVTCPWEYNKVWDERTITRKFPVVRTRNTEAIKNTGARCAHNPEIDCYAHTYDLWERWPHPGLTGKEV